MRRVPVSLHAFARDMRREDPAFSERLSRLESDHGPVDGDMLAVAAQASYLCWFEAGFPDSFVRACEAIGTGQPGRLSLCLQVSPERWRRLHHFVVAAQRWLGERRAVPESLDPRWVDRLVALLAERTEARRALTQLYLSGLGQHLRFDVSFGQLTGDVTAVSGDYEDYSSWWRRPDGGCYQIQGEPTFVVERCGLVRHHMADRPTEAEALLKGLLEPDRPPCFQRFLRHQEVRLASIGALRWRGNLPLDSNPRTRWEELFRNVGVAVEAWLVGQPVAGELARQIQVALGERNPGKVSLVTLFLMQPPTTGSWDWLLRSARQCGPDSATCYERR